MLAELARYAAGRGLDTEAGFRSKDVKWLLQFQPDGAFFDVMPYGGGDKRGRSVAKCPHLQFSGDTPMRQFLVDTAEFFALVGGEACDTKLLRKHAYVVGLLTEAGRRVLPELAPIAASMTNPQTIEAVRVALVAVKAKPEDNVTLSLLLPGLATRVFVEETTWHDWWRDYRPTLLAGKKAKKGAPAAMLSRCLVTGDLCEPALTHPKVRGLGDVGGKVETALVSFNQDAFCSYGLEQSANASVSTDAANAYVGALNDLIERTGQRLGNLKVVHWYAGADEVPIDVPPGQDPLRQAEEIDADLWGPPPAATTAPKKAKKRDEFADSRAEEQHAQAAARDFFASVATGERGDLGNYRYHTLVLSGSSARVMVRDYVSGNFASLCRAVTAWFDDLDIVARNGRGKAPSPKFLAVLGAMIRDLKDAPPPMAAKLWRCAALDEPIPEAFAVQALSRATADFIQGEAARHARMGLLRAYLVRSRQGDKHMKPFLNEEHPDPAYHCGRLLAVLADIQRAALPNVGAGVVQRFYAAAATTPALVLGRLVSLASVAHLPQIEGGLQKWHRDRLARVWGQLQQDPPTILSPRQQTLFAMGYYQQMAQPKTADNAKTETE